MATIDRDDPSSKKSNQFNNSLNTQNLDASRGAYSEFSFDFEGFDDSKDRKPDDGKKGRFDINWRSVGRRSGSGVAHGIAAALENQLPKTSEMYQDTKEFASDISQMKEELNEQLEPMITKSKVIGNRLLPKAKGLLPEHLIKKLEKVLHVDEESPAYDAQAEKSRRRQGEMESSLNSIFKADVELQMNAQRQAAVNRIIDQKVEGVRHKQLADELDAIKRQTYFHTNFLRSTYVAYMQKDLQLKYQMLYTQEDILTANKLGFQSLGVALEKIRHNTGLPDVVKKQTMEAAKEAMYSKMYSTLAGRLGNLGTKVLSGVKKRYIDPALGMANMAISGADLYTSMMGLDDDTDNPATKLLKTAAETAAKHTTKKIATRALSKAVDPQLRELIESTVGNSENIPLILESIRKNGGKIPSQLQGLLGLPGVGMLAKLAASTTEGLTPKDTRIRNKALEDPNGAGTITNRFTTTVEQIIPGYLRLQTKYLEAIATQRSPDEVEETVFHKGQMTRSSSARAALLETASPERMKYAAGVAIKRIKETADWNESSQELRDSFTANQATIAQIMSNMASTRSWTTMNTRGKVLSWLKNFAETGDAASGANDEDATEARNWQKEVFKNIDTDTAKKAAAALIGMLDKGGGQGTRGMIQAAMEAGVRDLMKVQAQQQESMQRALADYADWNGISTTATQGMFKTTKVGGRTFIDTSKEGTILGSNFLDNQSVNLGLGGGPNENFDRNAGDSGQRTLYDNQQRLIEELQEQQRTKQKWDPVLGGYRKLTADELDAIDKQLGWYSKKSELENESNQKWYARAFRGVTHLGQTYDNLTNRAGDILGNYVGKYTGGLQKSILDRINPDSGISDAKAARRIIKEYENTGRNLSSNSFRSDALRDSYTQTANAARDLLFDENGLLRGDISDDELEAAIASNPDILDVLKGNGNIYFGVDGIKSAFTNSSVGSKIRNLAGAGSDTIEKLRKASSSEERKSILKGLVSSAKSKFTGSTTFQSAKDAVAGWKDTAQAAYETARDKAQPFVDKAQETVEDLSSKISEMMSKASENATEAVKEMLTTGKLVEISSEQLETQKKILSVLESMQLILGNISISSASGGGYTGGGSDGSGAGVFDSAQAADPTLKERLKDAFRGMHKRPSAIIGKLAEGTAHGLGSIAKGAAHGLGALGSGLWNLNTMALKGMGHLGMGIGKLGLGALGYVPSIAQGIGKVGLGALKGVGSLAGGLLGMNARVLGGAFNLGRKIVGGTFNFLRGKGNPYVDVFVNDENFDPNKPRLLGVKIKEGAEDPSAATYFTTEGKPLKSAYEIKTAIVSADGKTTYIAEDELDKLCDREQKKLGRSRIRKILGGALGLAGGLLRGMASGVGGLFKAVGAIGKAGMSVLGGAGKLGLGIGKLGLKGIVGGLKGIFSPLFGDIFEKAPLVKRKDLQEIVGDKLEDIYVLLYERMGDNSAGAGDSDGDGIRDGSYEDYKKKKAARDAAREKKKEGADKEGSDEKKQGGWFSKLASLFGGKKNEDEDDDDMSLADINAAKDLGGWAKNKLGKAGKWLGKGGKSLLGKAGGLLAKGGTMLGGAFMSTSAGAATMSALGTAGSAVAGAASTAMGATAAGLAAIPVAGWVALGALAVGGGLYWAFSDSKNEDKWQELRGKLYGIDGKKYDGEIEDLEKQIRKMLNKERGPLTEDEILEFAKDFDFIDDGFLGMGGHSAEEIKKRAGYFQLWVSKRFIPIYGSYHRTVNIYTGDGPTDKPDPDDIPSEKQEEAQKMFEEEANTLLNTENRDLAPTEEAYKKFISKSESLKEEKADEAKENATKALSGTELLEKAEEADKKAQEEEEEETSETSEDTEGKKGEEKKSFGEKFTDALLAPGRFLKKAATFAFNSAVAVDKKLLSGMKEGILTLAQGSIAGGLIEWVRDKIDNNPFKKKLLEYLGIPEDFKYMPALKRLQNEYLSMVKGERDPIAEDELAKFAKGFGLVDQGFLSIFGGQGEAEIKSRTEFFIAWYRSRFAPVYTTYLNVVNVYSSTGDDQEMTDPHPENIPEDKLKNALEDFDNLAQQDLRSNDHAEDLAPTEEAYEEWYAKVHVLDETQETEATRERKETPLEWGKKVLSHTLFGKMLLGASDVTKSALEKLGVIDPTENRETEDEEDTSFVDKVKNAFSTAVTNVKNFVKNPFESIKNLFSSDDNKSGAPDNGESDSTSQSGGGYTSTDTGSGGAVATPVSVPEGDMQTNARLIYKALLEAGCTPEGAAGLLGNLRAESGLKAAIVQRGMGHTDAGFTAMLDELVRSGKNKAELTAIMKKKPYASVGYGLAQWTTAARKAGLILKAREKGTSVADINTQVEFLIDELKGGGYKKVWDALTSAKSVDDASTVVLKKFEAPADQGPATVAKRAGYGKGLFELLSKEINPDAQADLDKDAISAQNTDATSSSSSNTSTSSSGSTASSDTGTSGSGSYDSSQSSGSSGSVSTSGGDIGGLPSADGTSTSDSAGGTGESGDNSPIDPRLAGALSQYVVPKDKSVNLSGLDKKFQARLAAAAKEYQERTGKKLVVNEAKRDPKHQAELWVRGRILHEPGIHTPAKPPEKTTISYKGRQYDVPGSGRKNQHIQGAAIDVPARSGVAAVFDPIAQKYGLGRPWPQKDPPHFQVVDGSKPVGEFDGTSNEAPPADSSGKEGAPTQVEEMQKALDQKANEALTEDTPTPQETQVAEARADAEEKAADTVNQKFEKIPDKELAATDNQPVTDASTSAGTPITTASESPLKQQMAETITPEKTGSVGSPTEDAHLGELKLQTQLLSELRDTIKSYIDNKLNNTQNQEKVITPSTQTANNNQQLDSQALVDSLAQMFSPGSPVIAAIAQSISGGNTQSPTPHKAGGEKINMGTPINTRRQSPTYS